MRLRAASVCTAPRPELTRRASERTNERTNERIAGRRCRLRSQSQSSVSISRARAVVAAAVEFDEYIDDDEPWRAAAAATAVAATRQRTPPPQHWPRPLCPVHSPYSRVPPPLSASAVDVMTTGAGGGSYFYYNDAADFRRYHEQQNAGAGDRHQQQRAARHHLSHSHRDYDEPPASSAARFRTTTPPPPPPSSNAAHRHRSPYCWDTVVPPLPPSLYHRNAGAYVPYHHRSYHVSILSRGIVYRTIPMVVRRCVSTRLRSVVIDTYPSSNWSSYVNNIPARLTLPGIGIGGGSNGRCRLFVRNTFVLPISVPLTGGGGLV